MSIASPRRGIGFVVSSPSGAGKTTLSRMLEREDDNVAVSVSVTTRAPRAGEIDGVDYRFVDDTRFERMVKAGELLEHAEVFGRRYGTPRNFAIDRLRAGRDVVFDIDWQGAGQLRKSLAGDVVCVFVLPPSFETLRERLLHRAQDAEATIHSRMAGAIREMEHWSEYGYVLVNGDLSVAYRVLAGILESERHARSRQAWVDRFIEGFGSGRKP